MSINELFTHRPEAEIHRRIYLKKPAAVGSIKEIEYYFQRATEAVKEAEKTIALMQEYQQLLYERHREIYSTNYHLHLHIERRLHYDHTKTYHVTIVRRYEGNNVADDEILREDFDGKERHKALKRFEELKKEYPNIECSTDILKRQWER